MPRRTDLTLTVKNLGPIKDATIQFGDLTVLVGPQATGKSLLLQMMKLYMDGHAIIRELDENGFQVSDQRLILEQFLGEGMGRAWSKKTAISWEGRTLDPASLVPLTIAGVKVSSADREPEQVCYIPAQRSLALTDGWPQLFFQFQVPPPYVLRRYSQTLNNLLHNRSGSEDAVLFPVAGQIEASIRKHIDQSIFHGGKLYIRKVGVRRQLKLDYGSAQPSFSSWTAGQREFIPLLLALYRLMPSAGPHNRAPGTQWVVIEEPEMGLHPQAILSMMLLVLDLLRRGYRVAISTHSPLVLDIIWALKKLQQWHEYVKESDVLKLFGGLSINKVTYAIARAALSKDYRVYYMNDQAGEGAVAQDISALDPGAEEESMSGWGGLTGISSQISNVIGRIAAQVDAEDDT